MLAYAQARQDQAEKAYANLSSRGMAQCVVEMQERMSGLVDFMLKDLQVLLALDLPLRSKVRAMPKASLEPAPQPKKEDQSVMCQTGEKLRMESTVSTSEGTATHAPLNPQGVKPPPGFKAKPEDPELQPLIGMASEGPLPLEQLYEMWLISIVMEYQIVMAFRW